LGAGNTAREASAPLEALEDAVHLAAHGESDRAGGVVNGRPARRFRMRPLLTNGACAALSQGAICLETGPARLSSGERHLTCPAHHGLSAIANSSRGWPNLLEVGRNITQGSSATDGLVRSSRPCKRGRWVSPKPTEGA
jgi:hypothetical protein